MQFNLKIQLPEIVLDQELILLITPCGSKSYKGSCDFHTLRP